MLCRDVMLTLVFRCHEDMSAAACAQTMRDENIGFMPVVNGKGDLIGVVTDRDLALRVVAAGKPASTPVREVMSPGPIVTCEPDDNLRVLEQRMAEAKRSRALVLSRQGALLGVISLSDIAQAERSASRTGRLMRDVSRRESAMIARP